jgi:diamine N-acetyltransferase
MKTINDSWVRDLKNSLSPLPGRSMILHLLKEQDLPLTLSWRNRDDIRFNFKTSDILSLDQHVAWWKNYVTNNRDFVFVVHETINLNRPVGQISVYNIDLDNREAEFGRLMIGEKEARGKGLAKEATKLVVSWAFNTFQLKRIYLDVFKNNTGAVGLYRDCGFSIYGEDAGLYLMQVFYAPDKR